jgi:uncharacterized cupredoxin-like copper-binding protein
LDSSARFFPNEKNSSPHFAAGKAKADRTIQIHMSDNMVFSPKLIHVKPGQTIRFMIHNQGAVLHEFVMGTAKDLADHAELMKRFPDMEHDEPFMAHVMPGQTGEIHWTFNRAGEFEFACLMPGHMEAGMVGRIVVATQKERR